MQHALQLELLDRLLAHRAAGSTDAGSGAVRYAASIYTDPAQLAAERRTLFTQLPQLVGFSVQLPDAGDYLTHDRSGHPVVVCRQPDGSLAAYLNICRHRGARVVREALGHCERSFVCPYHAWRYAPDGSLMKIPCADQFAGVSPAEHGLRRLAVAEHAGLIFVVPDPTVARFDVAAWLGAFGEQVADMGLGAHSFYRASSFEPRVNWKMMIEANRESYHIPVLHGSSGGPRYARQLSLCDTQGPHSRIVLPHRTLNAAALGPQRDQWRLRPQADVVYFLFPNTLILFSAMAAHVLTVHPVSTGQSVVHGATLLPAQPEGPHSFQPAYYDTYWVTIGEDIRVSEDIQASAESQPDLQLWLGANETLLAEFHAAIAQALRGELPLP